MEPVRNYLLGVNALPALHYDVVVVQYVSLG